MSLVKIISQMIGGGGGVYAPPQPSLEIGGTPLYIIAGQSNTGRATVSEMTAGQQADYSAPVPNAKIWNSYSYFYENQTAFANFDPGINTMLTGPYSIDEFGPETALAKELQAYYSKPRYYFKAGTGNTDLAVNWNPSGGFHYGQMLDVLSAALNAAAAAGVTDLKLHAFIWMQGENDVIVPAYAAAYEANLANFFNSFHTWWTVTKGMNSNYKRVIGRIQDINAGDEETIRLAQQNYCANPANNAILINTDSYPRKDYIHYSATGQIQFGVDIFNQIKQFDHESNGPLQPSE